MQHEAGQGQPKLEQAGHESEEEGRDRPAIERASSIRRYDGWT